MSRSSFPQTLHPNPLAISILQMLTPPHALSSFQNSVCVCVCVFICPCVHEHVEVRGQGRNLGHWGCVLEETRGPQPTFLFLSLAYGVMKGTVFAMRHRDARTQCQP